MSDVPDQHHPERDQHHPERVRLYAQAHRLSNGTGCVLLVMQTDDGWSIHGLDLPGQGVHLPNDPKAGTGIHVSNDSMFLLAKSIVAKTILGHRPTRPRRRHLLIDMVDINSLLIHLMTPDAAAAGRRPQGHYIAACGADFIPASLTEPGHGRCQPCLSASIPRQKSRNAR